MSLPITCFKHFSPKKALEVLVWIASKWPGVSRFYVAKILYFADRAHVNHCGRPVLGDRYIAMEHGPVPSYVYDITKGNYKDNQERKEVQESLKIENKNEDRTLWSITATRKPDLEYLSGSDLYFLDESLNFCRDKKFNDLSKITHQHSAWKIAYEDKKNPKNIMNYVHMVDKSPIRGNLLEDLRGSSHSGLF